ncbi:hypothetical protein [Chryseobacterium vrystaatense]|uniref:CshA-type fibril repeat-containing protein n=1 Tax=Chryseobacterium vrystaatense TaxID=307480 RepID=A0A1M5MNK6_9FLAO|nr:hypothetical protein [Chryseobacterium vrystaatense]KFF24581.1 hypothetical protein IW16_19885 [Chryseobacterium vrystaatense]SHG78826.1 hypothetical protein SAMN02787073_4805 [Chryseobacterium vrystaatense]
MKKNFKGLSLMSLVFTMLTNFMYAQTDSLEVASIYGFYSYSSSLMNASSASELTIQGNASHTATGVQLTPATSGQFGGLFINGRSFTSVNGLHVEFEYDMKTGLPLSGTYGDGLSFFLYDGAVTSPTIGAAGAGLGYSYNRTQNTYSAQRKAGLSGAYLGIALDEFGNFKSKRFQGDSRVNGISGVTWGQPTSHVTLRGARGAALNTTGLGLGFSGYPVLVTRSTLSNTGVVGRVLQTDRSYAATSNSLASVFDLRNSGGEFRKVYLDLIPHFTSLTTTDGFDIKVDIQTTQNGTPVNIINYYHYKTSVPYTENANPQTTDFNTSDVEGTATNQTLDATVPAVLKLGFAAATGAAYQQHIIRNVKLTLPYAAVTNDDVATTCKFQPVSIPVFNNDIAYKGPISITTPPVGSNTNIDYKTFSFTKSGDTDLVLYRKKVTPQGTWSYNKSTGIVTFTPSSGFTGTATMTYTVKGKTVKDSSGKITEPYGDTAYRSVPATITVNLKTSGCIYSVISNRMVTQGVK